MTASPAPPWHELIVLMAHGPDRPMRGRIRHTDGEDPRGVGWVSLGSGPLPTFASGSQGRVEVWLRGDRFRLADADGRVTTICDGTTTWSFDGTDAPPREAPRHTVLMGLDGTELLQREPVSRWEGDDYTRPTGPVTATTFLGRPAWAVELAPPARKPFPLRIVVDAETGMLLQQRNERAGMVSEWQDLVVGDDLDPALFVWDGPVVTWSEQTAARQREIEQHQRGREQWVVENFGVRSLTVTLDAAIVVHRVDEDGSLEASIEPVGHLTRRPRSRAGAPRQDTSGDDSHDDDSTHRWSDGPWDWTLHTWQSDLAPGSLEVLKAQLASGTSP